MRITVCWRPLGSWGPRLQAYIAYRSIRPWFHTCHSGFLIATHAPVYSFLTWQCIEVHLDLKKILIMSFTVTITCSSIRLITISLTAVLEVWGITHQVVQYIVTKSRCTMALTPPGWNSQNLGCVLSQLFRPFGHMATCDHPMWFPRNYFSKPCLCCSQKF